ncbi:MAG: hypothetical protein R6V56_08890 [Lentisphaeria bacterium]
MHNLIFHPEGEATAAHPPSLGQLRRINLTATLLLRAISGINARIALVVVVVIVVVVEPDETDYDNRNTANDNDFMAFNLRNL